MIKFYDRILKLAQYDGLKLFGYACIVWITEQIVSRKVEKLIWGDHFAHWFDVAFTLGLFALYAIIAAEMADRVTATLGGENLDQASPDKSDGEKS